MLIKYTIQITNSHTEVTSPRSGGTKAAQKLILHFIRIRHCDRLFWCDWKQILTRCSYKKLWKPTASTLSLRHGMAVIVIVCILKWWNGDFSSSTREIGRVPFHRKYDITLSELICHLVLLTVPALCHCHEHKRSRNSRSSHGLKLSCCRPLYHITTVFLTLIAASLDLFIR